MGEYRLAVLVFGKLGRTGNQSLKSMSNFLSSNICVLGNEAGLSWLTDNMPEKSSMCVHEIDKEKLRETGLEGEHKSIESFGEVGFTRVTPLKWKLIKDVMLKHPESQYIVFSDLDVVWLNEISGQIRELELTSNRIFAQPDFMKLSKRRHFCTGIMYWRNCSQNLKDLDNLFNLQVANFKVGKMIPDEPSFNSYFRVTQDSDIVSSLDPDKYVIGHRIFEFLLRSGNYFESSYAYHANYLIGDFQKWIALCAVKTRRRNSVSILALLPLLMLFKFMNRLRLNRWSK